MAMGNYGKKQKNYLFKNYCMTKNEIKYTIGIDIGGTNMKAILFDGEKIIMDYKLATPKDTLEHFMIMLNALIEQLVDKAHNDKVKIRGIGLSIPGVHNYKEKRILIFQNAPILNGVKLADLVQKKFGLPVEMDNDANCFLRAEMKMGAGKKYSNAYGITIGTGIGGGWWYNNEIYQGSHGGAGEPGEMVIDVETGLRLEEAYHKLTQNNPSSVAEEAYRGDVLAEKVFEEVGYNLGIAFANIVNIVDPEVIIIGGGVVESSDLFLSKIKKVMREYIHSTESKKIKIIKGKLGEDAGAIGAALLVA